MYLSLLKIILFAIKLLLIGNPEIETGVIGEDIV